MGRSSSPSSRSMIQFSNFVKDCKLINVGFQGFPLLGSRRLVFTIWAYLNWTILSSRLSFRVTQEGIGTRGTLDSWQPS
ncbi:hypothetical protein CR513_03321, partial [Mucuna pruriens]